MTRSEIRTKIKNIVPRQPGDIDTVMNEYINTGVELFSSMIESIHDEMVWEHTFTAAEITDETNNWLLPPRTKRVISAAIIDVTGTEDVEIPLVVASPADKHRVGELVTGQRFDPTTFPVGGWRWDTGRNRHRGTYKRDGRPEVFYTINRNIYVYPRPDSTEAGNKLELFLTAKPNLLEADNHSNIITEQYPQAFIHYVAALTWFHFHQESRGQIQLQISAKLLEEFASDDEIQKLLQQHTQHMGRR